MLGLLNVRVDHRKNGAIHVIYCSWDLWARHEAPVYFLLVKKSFKSLSAVTGGGVINSVVIAGSAVAGRDAPKGVVGGDA